MHERRGGMYKSGRRAFWTYSLQARAKFKMNTDTLSERTVAKILGYICQSMLMARQKYSTYKLYAVTGLGHQVFLNAEN